MLDATTGQNALSQAKAFSEAVDVTAIVLAKLDGTAKGGIVFAICDQLACRCASSARARARTTWPVRRRVICRRPVRFLMARYATVAAGGTVSGADNRQ